MLTENALLERLDFSAPGMEAAAAKMKEGDGAAAIDTVIEHFRTRTSPHYLFEEWEIDRTWNEEIIAEADKICAHEILGIQLGEVIDWRTNASADTTMDPEWMWSLGRQIFWPPLARAWVMTGDDRYIQELVSQMKGFITSWPVEEFLGKIGEFGELTDMKYPANCWRTIEAAIRVYAVWLPLILFIRKSEHMDREAWVLFLNALGDHGKFLTQHYSCHSKCSNWDTMESTALFQLGVMLPEFKDSKLWQETGYRRAMNDVRYQFDHNGIHIERTPIYHLTATGAFLQVYRLAKKNGIYTPPYMLPILEKSAEFVASLIKPDLSTPMVGDADRNSLLTLRSDTSVYEGMNNTTDPIDENELRAFFRVMAELTDREDFRFFATAGKEGHAPEQCSYAYPDAGYYLFRSGWGRSDSYFMVSGTILERGENNVHSHHDVGHLELQVEGHDVLIDTGRYLYNSESQFDWRLYFYSTQAHNTIMIDDHIMGEHPDVIPTARGVRLFCHRFEPGSDVDLLEVSHNGYAYMEHPVFCKRRVIWLKPDVWVIEDLLTGSGTHLVQQFFNFAPGTLISQDETHFTYQNSGIEMEIAALSDGFESQINQGNIDPIAGWVSYGYAEKQPTPQLVFRKTCQVPVRLLTVFAKKGSLQNVTWNPGNAGGELQVRTQGQCWNITLTEDDCAVEMAAE